MKVTRFGLDLAKRLFQLHWVDRETGEICRRQMKRDELMEFFARREPSVVAMEACGGAHYWARKLSGYGHEVRLIAAQFVRPFVKSNKTDAADAQAIWEAGQRPGMKFVAVKSEAQQSVLTPHRMREQLVKMRTMRVNQLRGLLYEFGAELPQGRQRGIERIPGELEKLEGIVSAMVIETIRGQLKRIEGFDQDIAEIEKRSWRSGRRKTGRCGGSWRSRGWGCSAPRRRSPRLGMPRRSSRPASSPLSWGWCPARAAPGDG